MVQEHPKRNLLRGPGSEVPHFCGTKKISVALADGFADNGWRQQTTAAGINEASRCPNVTSWTHTDGQGNTQKSISDLQGLAAKGVNAIVVFPDAGPAMLPAIRDAFKQGSAVVPIGRRSEERRQGLYRIRRHRFQERRRMNGASGW